MTAQLDYDRTDIPASYDRGHDHGDAVLEQWMRTIAAHVEPAGVRTILDLACGTGRFAPILSEWFASTVIGLDPSLKMLRLAQSKCAPNEGVVLAGGIGEALPLRSHSVDLVFMSMVFHHFADPMMVGRECARVVRRGGHVCLRTITRDQVPNYPYYPFFPNIGPLVERRLPSLEESCLAFEAAGLRRRSAALVVQQIAPDYAAYADKLAAGADTSLACLDQREFAAGLASIRSRHVESAPVAITEPIDFIVFENPEDKE